MKKQLGIWLDFSEANLIYLDGQTPRINTILSKIEHQKSKGGSRSKVPWGPMDKVSESKHLARRKQQEQSYFEEIIGAIADTKEVYLFGPAEAKINFKKVLARAGYDAPKVLGLEVADSMTEKQKVAQVRAFFEAQGRAKK